MAEQTVQHKPVGISFGFMDSLLAEVAGVPQAALHLDVDAICRAYDAIVPVARRLGIDPPAPRLAGFSYNHVSTLGAKVTLTLDTPEPHLAPCIGSPAEIDNLAEPADYLNTPVVAERLELLERLRQRRPDAALTIGHEYQGPITTAALLMGPDFFMLPYDDPDRARRLLEFSVRSAVNYSRTIKQHLDLPVRPGGVGMPDDFAGMFDPATFAEFVVPAWEGMYAGQQATRRSLHSEMLREDHLRYLAPLKIDMYDPSVNHYLTPETVKRSCPVPFGLRIWPSEVMVRSADELVAQYRHLATFGPAWIMFHLDCLAHEPKIAAVMEVARELAEEPASDG